MTDTNLNSTLKDNLENSVAYADEVDIQHHLDTQGLICPEPVMMLHRTIRQAEGGDFIEILATDPATTRDIPNFCRHLGHTLIQQETSDDESLYRYLVKKKSN